MILSWFERDAMRIHHARVGINDSAFGSAVQVNIKQLASILIGFYSLLSIDLIADRRAQRIRLEIVF